jgi:hypothetical protein
LFKEFKLDEPWDSEHNKKLIPRMPSLFAPVRGKTKEPGMTYYQVFVGKDAPFDGTVVPIYPARFTDGTSRTFLVVESSEAVPWTKPQDIVYDAGKPLPKLGRVYPDGFYVAMADTTIRFVPRDADEKAIRAAITPAGNEDIDPPGKEVKVKSQSEQPAPGTGEKEDKPAKLTDEQVSAFNLKQIGLALIDDADTFRGHMASAAFLERDVRKQLGNPQLTAEQLAKAKGQFKGKRLPLLRWRVAILPFIEEQKLYLEFKLDEPWDSDHNKKLIPRMPKVYAPVRGKTKEPGMTYYQVFVGKDAPFDGTITRKYPAGFPDGASLTFLVVEGGEAVPWTKPQDIVYDAGKPLPKLGGLFPDGFHAVMADGSVRFVPRDADEKAIRAAITPAGNEGIDLPGKEAKLK